MKELSSNLEQIINFWVLPKHLNQILWHQSALAILVSAHNEIPIWIGVEVIGEQINLTICKRFKKLKVVEQWHQTNETLPFIKIQDLKSTSIFKEYRFAYPAGMYENQQIHCEELVEIINVLNLGKPDYNKIQELIWQNTDNPKADILKINSNDKDGEFILIDLWNCDQVNVMNCYFKTNGANSEFVYRSLYRWNHRLWQGLGPTVEEIVKIEEQKFVMGRNIINFETENAV
ncbi:MAG: hypothetical protein IPO37_13240 [Saprospiraceae bacterium]|nr:hypothetical protein [Saprospiraceae bacterium]